MTTKDILNIFQKGSVCELVDLILYSENAASHKYIVQKAKSSWMAKSEMTGH